MAQEAGGRSDDQRIVVVHGEDEDGEGGVEEKETVTRSTSRRVKITPGSQQPAALQTRYQTPRVPDPEVHQLPQHNAEREGPLVVVEEYTCASGDIAV